MNYRIHSMYYHCLNNGTQSSNLEDECVCTYTPVFTGDIYDNFKREVAGTLSINVNYGM